MGTTPEALGNVTASKMMEEMSRNGDGRISPRDFGWWLSDEGNPSGIIGSTAEWFECNSPGDDTDVEGEAQANGKVQQERGSVRTGLWGDQLEGQGHVVMRARKLLCLDCFNVNDLLEILAEAEVMVSLETVLAPVKSILICTPPEAVTRHGLPDLLVNFNQHLEVLYLPSSNVCFLFYLINVTAQQGSLGLDDFWRCICYVLQLGGIRDGTADWDEAFLLTECIHQAFEDADGIVDFAAITCGLSILCQSTVEDKASARCQKVDKFVPWASHFVPGCTACHRVPVKT